MVWPAAGHLESHIMCEDGDNNCNAYTQVLRLRFFAQPRGGARPLLQIMAIPPLHMRCPSYPPCSSHPP